MGATLSTKLGWETSTLPNVLRLDVSETMWAFSELVERVHGFGAKIFVQLLQCHGSARKAATCKDDKKRDGLRKALDRMVKATEANDYQSWREADMELHSRIFEMCENTRAARITNELNDQWYRVRIGLIALEGRVERSTPEHEGFVESILAGDTEKAEKLMRKRTNNVREELVNVLVNLVLPFAQKGV